MILDKYLPSYYRNSKVMRDILGALETEYLKLKNEIQITEDTFFVLFSEKYIDRHLSDLGLPRGGANVDAKRSRILARLRGQGTMTVTSLCNVLNSYVYGTVKIEEYPAQYLFKIKFISQKGTPANMDEIRAVLEEIKPAHLAVDFIFTYRVWQEVKSGFTNWGEVKTRTWGDMRTFNTAKRYLHITEDGRVFFCPNETGNAKLEWLDGRAYAVRTEEAPLLITESGKVYYCSHGSGNAALVWRDGRPYAMR